MRIIKQRSSMVSIVTITRMIATIVIIVVAIAAPCYGDEPPKKYYSRIPNVPTAIDLAEDDFTYNFDQYIVDFDKEYQKNHEEYNKRQEIFERNLRTVIQHNRNCMIQRKHQQLTSYQASYRYVHSDEEHKDDIDADDESSINSTSTITNNGKQTLNRMAQRQAIFEQRLTSSLSSNSKQSRRVLAVNNNNEKEQPQISNHLLGINHLMDLLPEELPRGYNKLQSSNIRLNHHHYLTEQGLLVSSNGTTATARRRRLQTKIEDQWEDKILKALGGSYLPVEKLPKSVDWRFKGVTTPIKNQGGCGSCWAFASTAVLESHIAIETGLLYELSEQQFVSCAENPYHCGGSGGCAGATAEIAYDHVKQYGIVEEWQFGYQDSRGDPITCKLKARSSNDDDNDSTTSSSSSSSLLRRKDVANSTYYRDAVATIEDYAVLPSNNYLALINVVARLGPVAVSVACLPWQLYQSGVFYQPLSPDGDESTDIDHLVVLEGYGTDTETGDNYWLVRNSWGPRWGENGYIRLKRTANEETECGTDTTPQDGDACAIDENGNPITPEPQVICGNSGILFDSVIPLGGKLL